MRKLLILCFITFSTISYSQKEIAWFDAAIKVMYGSSNIINNAAIDNPNLNYELNFGTAVGFGGKFGINKGYNGLAIELMYTKSGQTFEYLNSTTIPKIDWSSLDLYLLFRNAKNLGFFEIGPKIGFLRSIDRTGADGTVSSFENFNSRQISGVLGFGVNVVGTDGSFSGQIGLRFEYGFTDLNGEDEGTLEPFPFDASIYTGSKGYQKSSPIFAGLVFELNWGLGYYGIAQCGARAKFFKT
ncbi:MAG: hypothetical protein P1U56_11595 [Saprospiraceae bacterium]|nr:hypothetical protein [Saprospiraceae bacterium]